MPYIQIRLQKYAHVGIDKTSCGQNYIERTFTYYGIQSLFLGNVSTVLNYRKFVQTMKIGGALNIFRLHVDFFIHSIITFLVTIFLSFGLWTDRCNFIVNIAIFINLANQSPFNNVATRAICDIK